MAHMDFKFAGLTEAAAAGVGSMTASGVTGADGLLVVVGFGSASIISAGGLLRESVGEAERFCIPRARLRNEIDDREPFASTLFQ